MTKIRDYSGRLLNHIEALYRPGERALAIELAEPLGCAMSDTGLLDGDNDSFLAVHPDPDDRNLSNNAFYISQMTPEHLALEDALRITVEHDQSLQELLADYRALARSRPFGVPHFGLRYNSLADVEDAIEAIETRISPRLGERIHTRIYHPGDTDAAGGEAVQAFIHQDVIVSGAFLFGQIIELQKQS